MTTIAALRFAFLTGWYYAVWSLVFNARHFGTHKPLHSLPQVISWALPIAYAICRIPMVKWDTVHGIAYGFAGGGCVCQIMCLILGYEALNKPHQYPERVELFPTASMMVTLIFGIANIALGSLQVITGLVQV